MVNSKRPNDKLLVTIDEHSGFCFGVTRAIKAAESELANGPLYCLGDIVHNGQEVKRLEIKGLQTIDYDDLRTLPPHSRVLLRAHGEPPSTYWIAQQRGIEIIDATCPVVKKLQDRIRACYEAHKNDEPQPPQIVIYGKPGHAEVIGLQGQTNNTAVVIEDISQLDHLDFSRPIYLFSQTTKSVEGFNHLVETILQRKRSYSASGLTAEPSFEYHDTICRNVANRVAELQAFARANDIVLFVGGAKSSNAKVLYQKCVEANPDTLFISSPDELEEKLSTLNLKTSFNFKLSTFNLRVGICGATSTPLWLMEQVRDKLSLIPSL
ncbi:MAG: 4-hydroxy-3-methylbut-2-enyl diphosphate reductase [Paludibacteraceae bacterium]